MSQTQSAKTSQKTQGGFNQKKNPSKKSLQKRACVESADPDPQIKPKKKDEKKKLA